MRPVLGWRDGQLAVGLLQHGNEVAVRVLAVVLARGRVGEHDVAHAGVRLLALLFV